ncbi:MAG: capsular biosynthesis protein [Pontixanthobacter sp.]
MTEHSKIAVPRGGHKDSGKHESGISGESSLFERANGAFGFDTFKASPITSRLPDAPMKHVKTRDLQPYARPQGQPQTKPRTDTSGQSEAAATHAHNNSSPERRGSTDLIIDRGAGAIALSGKQFPVDRDHLRNQGLIAPEGTTTALLEEFRIVKRRLLKTAHERGTAQSRRILVCSPHPGEGKTFCASNLAIAMAAERDGEVLLIDGDFAKPSILSTFGLPSGPGFMDCLADPSIQPEELVIGTDIPGLWVLPCGNQTHSDSEYLASSRTAQVLDRLTVGSPNRIVIFDSPPALSASPAAELAKHVGQALLVARADKTGQSALEDACQLLSACPDIKLILNAAQFSPSGRNFGAYYGYGE